MSVDIPIVQLQEVTQRNMKSEYRNSSGNAHFREFSSVRIGIYIFKYPILAVENSHLAQNKKK